MITLIRWLDKKMFRTLALNEALKYGLGDPESTRQAMFYLDSTAEGADLGEFVLDRRSYFMQWWRYED